MSRVRARRPARAWHDPAVAKEFITYIRTLYATGRIARHDYIFHAVWPVERVYERRVEEGHYRDLLRLREALEEVSRLHGLIDGQHWLRGHGPVEYERLSLAHEAEHGQRFHEALREFGLRDIAALFNTDSQAFERLRERGRRVALHGQAFYENLRDNIVHYEQDARRAAAAGAGRIRRPFSR